MRIEVKGPSMAPLFATGDWCVVRRVLAASLRAGHVIVFRLNGVVIVHRIIARRVRSGRLQLLQKGDNASAMTWIPAEAVLGRVMARERLGREFSLTALLPAALALLMVLIGRLQRLFDSLYLWAGGGPPPHRLVRLLALLRRLQTAALLRLARVLAESIVKVNIKSELTAR